MYRVYLLKKVQYDTVAYEGPVDVRRLDALFEDIQAGSPQETQRPLNDKKVKESAKYAASSDAIIPGEATIVMNSPLLKVHQSGSIYYVDFPEPGDPEFEALREDVLQNRRRKYNLAVNDERIGVLSIPDGQHRITSFREKYCLIPDNEVFELGCCFYEEEVATIDVRRKIFHQNTKQDKIKPSLRTYQEKQLGLLSDEESLRFAVLERLNEIENSPIREKISFNGEREVKDAEGNVRTDAEGKVCKTRYQLASMMLILSKYGIIERISRYLHIQGKEVTADACAERIVKYLKSVENALCVSFAADSFAKNERQSYCAKATNNVALEMMLALFVPLDDYAKKSKRKVDDGFIRECVNAYLLKKNWKNGKDYKPGEIFLITAKINGGDGRNRFLEEFKETLSDLEFDADTFIPW